MVTTAVHAAEGSLTISTCDRPEAICIIARPCQGSAKIQALLATTDHRNQEFASFHS
jgi:hypothetical protein